MIFANPHFLWALILLLFLGVYEYAWGLHAKARIRFSSFTLFGDGPAKMRRNGLIFLTILRLMVLLLVIVALARPQKGQEREQVLAPATDIMLCVDTSSSMEALDFKPKNRLEAAKDVIKEFIKNRPHDRIGLVVFSGLAFTQCPLTLDHGALLGFMDHVKIGMIGEDGTAIGSGIATAVSRLKDSAAKSKMIVLLTDGRNNQGAVDPVTAAKTSAAFGIKIYTIGAGAPGGAVYPVDDPFFGKRYVTLPEDLDEDTLRQVANATHGLYFRATDLKSLKNIYAEIDEMEKTDIQVDTFAEYKDLYPPLLMLAFMLFVIEITLSQTLLRRFP